MNLYRISQDVNSGYDTYDSAIVAAESGEAARLIHPSLYGHRFWDGKNWLLSFSDNKLTVDNAGEWCNPNLLTVELIGVAKPDTKSRVLVSSYNAG